ncbi:MAG: hypothetical protein ACKVU2_11075, partial [Saprospiraceae bacterium]
MKKNIWKRSRDEYGAKIPLFSQTAPLFSQIGLLWPQSTAEHMVPLWKKWFSYLVPITLERAGSSLNPDLAVVLDRGRLQLL